MDNQQPRTREQLADAYQWSQFPEEIQARLYLHATTFIHQGDLRLAESDIQSASDTLSWAMQGIRLDPFLKEHRAYFGQASTNDLADIVQQLRALQHLSDQRSS